MRIADRTQPLGNLVPPPPTRHRSAPTGSMPEDEDEALCARYEAEQARYEAGETAWGCDWPEGPLATEGVRW